MNTQYGFRKYRSTKDAAILVAKRMIENTERAGMKGLMILLDREKAFDKISNEWLFNSLEGFPNPEEILGVIRSLYDKPQFYVEIEGVKSRVAQQSKGIRQGCPFSPYLFIMVMDRIFNVIPDIGRGHQSKMRIQKRKQEGVVKSFNALLYADDTLLCDNTDKETQALRWAV